MTLRDLLSLYATIRPVSAGYKYQLDRTARLFGEWLNHPADTADLTDERVSSWLRSLELTHGARTRAGHRGNILVLWRFAARRKLAIWPDEVRRCPRPEPMPQAYELDEVARLLSAAAKMGGRAGPYLHALVGAAFESGLRRSDLWGLARPQIRPDGLISVRQHKTQRPHLVAVRPETAAEILALPGDHPLAPPVSIKRYGEWWVKLRAVAGVSSGACQQLRRTGATWIAVRDGESAAREWLGHRSLEMVRHYLDRSKTQPRPRLPPRAS